MSVCGLTLVNSAVFGVCVVDGNGAIFQDFPVGCWDLWNRKCFVKTVYNRIYENYYVKMTIIHTVNGLNICYAVNTERKMADIALYNAWQVIKKVIIATLIHIFKCYNHLCQFLPFLKSVGTIILNQYNLNFILLMDGCSGIRNVYHSVVGRWLSMQH